jgi:hypothetical protein
MAQSESLIRWDIERSCMELGGGTALCDAVSMVLLVVQRHGTQRLWSTPDEGYEVIMLATSNYRIYHYDYLLLRIFVGE